jgi:hypothetical protein
MFMRAPNVGALFFFSKKRPADIRMSLNYFLFTELTIKDKNENRSDCSSFHRD